jgi:hypothetical protein
MMPHCLKCIHCNPDFVRDKYMEHFKKNDWDEKEERDAHDFLESERELCTMMFQYS